MIIDIVSHFSFSCSIFKASVQADPMIGKTSLYASENVDRRWKHSQRNMPVIRGLSISKPRMILCHVEFVKILEVYTSNNSDAFLFLFFILFIL